ncbi:MAG: winged helix-turn-helix domain-containing protein, partial [Cyanobacteriota bacterium]
VSGSPRDYGYAFRRWTANWLSKHLAKELGISISDRHVKRLLKQMGLSTRPQPNNVQENTTFEVKNSKILIEDLKPTNLPDNTECLPINFETLGTDSDIHGGKFIRAVNFSGTTQQYFGVFSFPSGIPTLY